MTLIARLTTSAYNALNDELKKEYLRDGDYYKLDVQGVDGWQLEDVAGLKSALSEEREKARTAKAALTKFGEITPEQAKQAIEKLASGAPTGKDQETAIKEAVEARTKQIKSELEAREARATARATALAKMIEKNMVESAAATALAKHKGNAALLMPHVRDMVRVVEDEHGNFSISVVDEKGNPRISMRQGQHGPMGVEELVESLKTQGDYSRAFDGNRASGGGMDPAPNPGGNGNSNHGQQNDLAKLPPIERMKAFRKEQAAANGN